MIRRGGNTCKPVGRRFVRDRERPERTPSLAALPRKVPVTAEIPGRFTAHRRAD